MNSTSQTLADRIALGPLPTTDALRIAGQLAEQLRQLHEQGRPHAGLTPSTVAIYGTSAQLLPADAAPGLTPYTAPELLQGNSPDERSDIFAFGAILYEMLTGRRAFEADSPEALAALLDSGAPWPSGSPAVD